MSHCEAVDSNRKQKARRVPAKTYSLRNGSNRNNFFQCNESFNVQDSNSSTSGGRGPSSAKFKPSGNKLSEDELTRCGAVKLPSGAYSLNGMELSKEELDFVLENALPQESSSDSASSCSAGNLHAGGNKRSNNKALTPKKLSRNSNNASAKQVKFRTNPSTPTEKVLAQFTKEILDASVSDEKEEPCSICLSPCHEKSCYETAKQSARDLVGCVSFSLCGHTFHTCCLLMLVPVNSSSISCPNCKTIHGVLTGTQPVGGTMTVGRVPDSLPGYPDAQTIIVSYSFPRGVQGPEHPNPGQPYKLVSFPRVGYFPDTPKGNKVLSLLREAFNRRLIFTVGTSATTGTRDCVVWNGIHHKTETTNYGGHGYPDPNYLDNVIMELAAVGVTDDS
ncbi:Zinc finger RING-type [Trinorchestia longiramus]|nr:Zinc finger RING-type [Trinorchestia longiramus]